MKSVSPRKELSLNRRGFRLEEIKTGASTRQVLRRDLPELHLVQQVEENRRQAAQALTINLQIALSEGLKYLHCSQEQHALGYLRHGTLETYPYRNTIDGLIPKSASVHKIDSPTIAGDLDDRDDLHAFPQLKVKDLREIGEGHSLALAKRLYEIRFKPYPDLHERKKVLFIINRDPFDALNPKNLLFCANSSEASDLKNQLVQIFTELINSQVIGFHPGSSTDHIQPHYFIADSELRKTLVNLEIKKEKLEINPNHRNTQDKTAEIIPGFDVSKKRSYLPGRNTSLRASTVFRQGTKETHHLNHDRNNGEAHNLYTCSGELHRKLHIEINSILSFLIKKGVISFFPENLTEAKLSQENGIKPHYFINLPYLRDRLREPYPEPRSSKPFIDLLSKSSAN